MAAKTEKELSESLRALWLKAVAAIAGHSQAGAGVSDGAPTVAAGRGDEKQIDKEKFFQHFYCADRGHEGAARNQKGPETRH